MIVVDAAIAELDAEQRSEWSEIYAEASWRDPLDALASWTPEHRAAIRTALSTWAMEQADAREALRTLWRWSRRLCVALACEVAREALHRVPDEEPRPMKAIETAERWVRRGASSEECRRAADAANAASKGFAGTAMRGSAQSGAYSASHAAAHAAYSAWAAEAIGVDYIDPADPAYYVAMALAPGANIVSGIDELQRLCHVIGQSMLAGLVADWLS